MQWGLKGLNQNAVGIERVKYECSGNRAGMKGLNKILVRSSED